MSGMFLDFTPDEPDERGGHGVVPLAELARRNNAVLTIQTAHRGWVLSWGHGQLLPCRNRAQLHKAVDEFAGYEGSNVIPSVEAPDLVKREPLRYDDDLARDLARALHAQWTFMMEQHPHRRHVGEILERAHKRGWL